MKLLNLGKNVCSHMYVSKQITNLKCETKSRRNINYIDDELVCRRKNYSSDRQIRNKRTRYIGEYGIGEHGIGKYGIGEHGNLEIGEYGIGEMHCNPLSLFKLVDAMKDLPSTPKTCSIILMYKQLPIGVTSNFGSPQDLKNWPPIPHLALYGLKMGPFLPGPP